MCELLRQRPVERPRVALRELLPVQLHLERDVDAPVAAPGQMRQRGGILCGRLDPRVLEQRERRHPGRDGRLERLAEVRAKRHVLPRLDVAGAPVVDEHDAEYVVGERLDRHGLAELRRNADDEAELELEVESAARAEGRRLLVRSLPLAAGPDDVRSTDDDAARSAVIRDREPAPVRQQRFLVGPEYAAEVRGVLERRVEVDVVRDVERQTKASVSLGDARPVVGAGGGDRLLP